MSVVFQQSVAYISYISSVLILVIQAHLYSTVVVSF